MPMYDALFVALKATGIPFAEYEWATRPTGDFGLVGIDMEAAALIGDGEKLERAYEGTVDLFLQRIDKLKIKAVEDVLKQHCGSSWREEDRMYETATKLLHIQWVFQLEEL